MSQEPKKKLKIRKIMHYDNFNSDSLLLRRDEDKNSSIKKGKNIIKTPSRASEKSKEESQSRKSPQCSDKPESIIPESINVKGTSSSKPETSINIDNSIKTQSKALDNIQSLKEENSSIKSSIKSSLINEELQENCQNLRLGISQVSQGEEEEQEEFEDISSIEPKLLLKKILNSFKGVAALDRVIEKYKKIEQKKNRQSILNNLALIEKDFLPKQEILVKNSHCKIPVIPPECTFMNCWSIIIGILMLYTMIIMPYKIAFIETENMAWKVLEIMIDFIFMIDVVITFNLGYFNENGDVVTDHWKIAKRYLLSWFIIDFITSLPQGLIFSSDSKSIMKNADLLRLVKLAKLNRIVKVFRFVKIARMLRKFKIFDSIYSKIKINFGLSKIISFIFKMILIFHIVACLWYFFGKIYDERNNWFVNIGIDDDSNVRKYFFSVYWTVTTIFTMGFGDVTAYNYVESIFSMIWMVFGVVFFSIMIGTLSSVISNSESRKTLLDQKLQILENFAQKTNLSKALKRKIAFVLLSNSKNEQSTNNYNLLNEIPSDLKFQVAHAVQKGYLKDIFFLSQIMYPNFISVIIQFLTPVIFIENEIVYETGDTPRCMYFILKGRIKFFTNERIPYCTFNTGSHFGEIDINEQQRIHNVISTQNSDFLSLSKKHFNEIFGKDFQEVYMQLIFLARKRKIRLDKLSKTVTSKYFNLSNSSVSISSGIDDSFSDEDDVLSHSEEEKIEQMLEENKKELQTHQRIE